MSVIVSNADKNATNHAGNTNNTITLTSSRLSSGHDSDAWRRDHRRRPGGLARLAQRPPPGLAVARLFLVCLY